MAETFETELVTFVNVPPTHETGNDVSVQYRLTHNVKPSPKDWIGIFRSSELENGLPLAFQWASSAKTSGKRRSKLKDVTFPATVFTALRHPTDTFQYAYVSTSGEYLGVSRDFKVMTCSSPQVKSRKKTDSTIESPSTPSSLVIVPSDDEWEFAAHSVKVDHSWSSDLSDIVVLSTSPSKEAGLHQDQTPSPLGPISSNSSGFVLAPWPDANLENLINEEIERNQNDEDVCLTLNDSLKTTLIKKTKSKKKNKQERKETQSSSDTTDGDKLSSISVTENNSSEKPLVKKPDIDQTDKVGVVDGNLPEIKSNSPPAKSGKKSKKNKSSKKCFIEVFENQDDSKTSNQSKPDGFVDTAIFSNAKPESVHKEIQIVEEENIVAFGCIIETGKINVQKEIPDKKKNKNKGAKKCLIEVFDNETDEPKNMTDKDNNTVPSSSDKSQEIDKKVKNDQNKEIKKSIKKDVVMSVVPALVENVKQPEDDKSVKSDYGLNKDNSPRNDIKKKHKATFNVGDKCASINSSDLSPKDDRKKKSKADTCSKDLFLRYVSPAKALPEACQIEDSESINEAKISKTVTKRKKNKKNTEENIATEQNSKQETLECEEKTDKIETNSKNQYSTEIPPEKVQKSTSEDEEIKTVTKRKKNKRNSDENVVTVEQVPKEEPAQCKMAVCGKENKTVKFTTKKNTFPGDEVKGVKNMSVQKPTPFPGDEVKEIKNKYVMKSMAANAASKKRKRAQRKPCQVYNIASLFGDEDEEVITPVGTKTTCEVENVIDTSVQEFPSLPESSSRLPNKKEMSNFGGLSTPWKICAISQKTNTPKSTQPMSSKPETGLPTLPKDILELVGTIPEPRTSADDGKSLMEWQRTMVPMLEKGSLPYFKAKYKAKKTKGLELRRHKLKKVNLTPSTLYKMVNGSSKLKTNKEEASSLADTVQYTVKTDEEIIPTKVDVNAEEKMTSPLITSYAAILTKKKECSVLKAESTSNDPVHPELIDTTCNKSPLEVESDILTIKEIICDITTPSTSNGMAAKPSLGTSNTTSVSCAEPSTSTPQDKVAKQLRKKAIRLFKMREIAKRKKLLAKARDVKASRRHGNTDCVFSQVLQADPSMDTKCNLPVLVTKRPNLFDDRKDIGLLGDIELSWPLPNSFKQSLPIIPRPLGQSPVIKLVMSSDPQSPISSRPGVFTLRIDEGKPACPLIVNRCVTEDHTPDHGHCEEQAAILDDALTTALEENKTLRDEVKRLNELLSQRKCGSLTSQIESQSRSSKAKAKVSVKQDVQIKARNIKSQADIASMKSTIRQTERDMSSLKTELESFKQGLYDEQKVVTNLKSKIAKLRQKLNITKRATFGGQTSNDRENTGVAAEFDGRNLWDEPPCKKRRIETIEKETKTKKLENSGCAVCWNTPPRPTTPLPMRLEPRVFFDEKSTSSTMLNDDSPTFPRYVDSAVQSKYNLVLKNHQSKVQPKTQQRDTKSSEGLLKMKKNKKSMTDNVNTSTFNEDPIFKWSRDLQQHFPHQKHYQSKGMYPFQETPTGTFSTNKTPDVLRFHDMNAERTVHNNIGYKKNNSLPYFSKSTNFQYYQANELDQDREEFSFPDEFNNRVFFPVDDMTDPYEERNQEIPPYYFKKPNHHDDWLREVDMTHNKYRGNIETASCSSDERSFQRLADDLSFQRLAEKYLNLKQDTSRSDSVGYDECGSNLYSSQTFRGSPVTQPRPSKTKLDSPLRKHNISFRNKTPDFNIQGSRFFQNPVQFPRSPMYSLEDEILPRVSVRGNPQSRQSQAQYVPDKTFSYVNSVRDKSSFPHGQRYTTMQESTLQSTGDKSNVQAEDPVIKSFSTEALLGDYSTCRCCGVNFTPTVSSRLIKDHSAYQRRVR